MRVGQARDIGQHAAPGLYLAQGTLCVLAKHLARLRQAQATPHALKQLHAKLVFQLTQAVRQGRLRDEQVARRIRQVLGLGDV